MNKKKKAFVAVGGTGGHVFPGCNLAKHLVDIGYEIEIITDKRGQLYLDKFRNYKITELPSSPIISKNIFTFFYTILLIFYSFIKSVLFLALNRPTIIFGMGGYASFPVCIAAYILRIEFIIYENNLIIGKANNYLLPFTKKIFVAFKEIEGISEKYNHKVIKIGNIIKKEILNFPQKNSENLGFKELRILVLGGSQAAKIFAEKLPEIFCKCKNSGISLKIYQHCLSYQVEKLKLFYEENCMEFETFNFSNNLEDYFSKVNLAITRSGSSMLAELTNANIPFISVPLPTSADNHQLKNSIFYQENNLGLLIEEKELNDKLFYHINEMNKNNSILNNIKKNQRQFSDKSVYLNIERELKKIIDEKN